MYIYIHLGGGDLNLVDISNHDVFNTEIRRSLEQRSYKHQTCGVLSGEMALISSAFGYLGRAYFRTSKGPSGTGNRSKI